MSNDSDASDINPSRSRSDSDSLLSEFRNRRRAGERITAEQFIAQRNVHDDPELVVDIAFADFLEAEKNGETGVCERLCQQLPTYAKEIRRQILFHQALARESTEPTYGGSKHESDKSGLTSNNSNADPYDASSEPVLDEAMNWFSIPGLDLLKPLGRGGMGIVYLAHQPKLNRKVAVKLLLGGMYASTLHRARFRAEARAAASLRHPNIVQIDEVGEAHGQPYLVMEYVEGGTLEEYIKKHNPSPHESAELVLTLARAIHEAHQRGIIHRDLKPGNIMLAPRQSTSFAVENCTGSPTSDRAATLADWNPKITDFGMAKILGSEQSGLAGSTLTMAGDLLGTPSYMAPEQASGGVIGTWSDVYSLGAILYQLLSGRPPFLAATAWETLEHVLNDDPPALPRSVPLNLRTICMTCLRKQPMSRYTSMNLVVSDIERFLAGKPIAARRHSTWEQVTSWYKRNKSVAVLASTVFLALLATLGITLWSRSQLALALSENKVLRHGEAASHLRSLAHLWDSLISQAQAQQSTGYVGQRVNSLASVTEAKELLKQVGANPERNAALRDTAAACLVLDDICKIADWKGPPFLHNALSTDNGLNRVAQIYDGKLLVTEDFGAKKIHEIPLLGASGFALSPNGRWLAAWNQECHVYDLQQSPAKAVGSYTSNGYWGFSGNGKWLVGADIKGTIVVDMESNTIRHRVDIPGATFAPTFANDDRKVALLSPKSLVVLDIESDANVTKLDAPVDPHGIQCLAWHPNSSYLAISGYSNEVVAILDIHTQRTFRSFRQPGGAVAVAFDGSGNRLITSSGWLGEVNVWDLESESLLLCTRARNLWITTSPGASARMFANSVGGANEVLEIRTQKIIQPYHSTSGSTTKRFNSANSPSGRWSAVSTERGIELYDNHAKSIVVELPIGQLEHNRVAFDSCERLWACKKDGLLCWRFDNSGLLPPVKFNSSAGFVPINVNHDGSWSLTSDGNFVKLESLSEPYREIRLGATFDVRSASFSSDGRMVATGENNGSDGVKVWSTTDSRLLAELKTGLHSEVLFSPDGKYLFTSPNGGEVWETTGWAKYHRLESPDSSVGGGFAYAFSRDSRWLANSHSTGHVSIWDLDDRRRAGMMKDPEQKLTANLAFSKDKRELYRISSGSRTAFQSWDLVELTRELQGMSIDAPGMAFSNEEVEKPLQGSYLSQKEFSVSNNKLFNDLVLSQLQIDKQKALSQNDWQTALKRYDAALRVCPHDPLMLNSFAWNLLIAPHEYRDNARALKMASEAVALNETQSYINTLGVAQYRNGLFQEAIVSLSKSLGDGTVITASYDYYLLVCCRAKLGQRELAKQLLAKGIESHQRHVADMPETWRRELNLFRAEAEETLAEMIRADQQRVTLALENNGFFYIFPDSSERLLNNYFDIFLRFSKWYAEWWH